MNILGIHGGISVNQHDAGAALIVDGELKCCIEEERLIRIKSARGVLPIQSIAACLKEANLPMNEIDLVLVAGDTYGDLKKRTSEYLKHHFGCSPNIELVNHQEAHLASAFYPSDFSEAMCLSYDAYGDRLSLAMGVGSRAKGISVMETRTHENSLGMFYATMTSYLGFMPGEDEYKVMGLAPYGTKPVDLSFFAAPASDGYLVDRKYIRNDPPAGSIYEQFYSDELINKIGSQRHKSEEISQYHRDVAAGTQNALEECAISLVTYLHKMTGLKNLCLAGGVALNCSLNGKLQKLPFIDNIFIQPAASDRGLALGCAIFGTEALGKPFKKITNLFYGPSYDEGAIVSAIKLAGFPFVELKDPSLTAAQLIADGKIIGWMQDRSEFGPRALGNRSILANPGLPNMKQEINSRIKFREEFRPFAPSVLEDAASQIFDMNHPSPYMTIAFPVRDVWTKKLPATTHVNKTGRVQTVNQEQNKKYFDLISGVKAMTGIPVVLNTSFNIKGQPIVETPLEGLSTFAGTGMDALIMGNYLLTK